MISLSETSLLLKTRAAIRSLLSPQGLRTLNKMFWFSLTGALLDVFGIALLVYLFHYIMVDALSVGIIPLLISALVLVVLFIIKNIISTILTSKQAGFAFNEALFQSHRVFKHIYLQDDLFFRKNETGALISDIMYVPNSFSNGVILGYITLLTELSVLILMLLFLAITSFYISLLLFLFIAPAAYFSYQGIKNKIQTLGEIRNANVKKGQDALIQSIRAHHDAVLYDRKKYFENFFSSYQAKISATDAEVFTLNSIPPRLMEIFAVLAFCLIYFFNKQSGTSDSLSFDITLFVAAAFRLLPSVNRSLGSMLRIKNHWFAIEVLSRYKDINTFSKSIIEIQFKKSIVLKNIKFAFEGNQVCSIKNLIIERGTCIGIYGNTGEGKSTFIQLLMKLIPASSGNIYVDELEIMQHNRDQYAQLFAYISQDVFILNASLQENISLSQAAKCDTERVENIITILELNKISHLFTTVNSNAGESGNKLSGGQKKFIALARALYFDRPVIVLDEIFASLDTESTNLVLNILKQEHRSGKTIIIVSHQKKVFEICDLVYEYKNGDLVISE